MKGLGGILQAKGHERKLKNAKRGGNHSFLNVFRVARNLVMCSHQVSFGEYGATGKAYSFVCLMLYRSGIVHAFRAQ